MSKRSAFKVFLFFLFVCKFFHFNAPFFEDLYRKHFVLVEIPAQILSTRSRVDNIGFLPEYVFISFNLLHNIFTTKAALKVQNISYHRPIEHKYGFYLDLLFELNKIEQRRSYIYGQILGLDKAEEYRQQLKQNPGKAISTSIFIYPDVISQPYLTRDEIREANIYQIQAFFYSLIFLGLIGILLFYQTPHLIALRILAFGLLFLIFSTYNEYHAYTNFFSSCFIYLYYRIISFLYRLLFLRLETEVKT